jgi:hypothetical protein
VKKDKKQTIYIVQEVSLGVTFDPDVFDTMQKANVHYVRCVNETFGQSLKTYKEASRFMSKRKDSNNGILFFVCKVE